MKNFIKFILAFFITIMILFGVSTVIPKVLDIYKNKPVIEKVDTILTHDTLYFEKTVTDTMPEYRYETIIKYDTLYKLAKGDSIEKIPRRLELKKKLPVKLYPWGMIH